MDDSAARIAQLEAQLTALQGEMQQLTHVVSHDLRAPLRHIVSYTQLVREDAGPLLTGEVQGFLDTVTDSAGHLGAMLDALLRLSRVGAAPVQIGAVALQEVVVGLCEEMATRYPGREVQCDVNADALEVQADASLLQQALWQVLDNAWKFTAPVPQAQVSVSAFLDADGRVQLTVRDNGVGCNPALQGKLFQVFSRLHSGQQFAGLGVGLALARKGLQRMGATVTLRSAVDEGCSVTMRLPQSQRPA
jgi:signal transduction histidine kinase